MGRIGTKGVIKKLETRLWVSSLERMTTGVFLYSFYLLSLKNWKMSSTRIPERST